MSAPTWTLAALRALAEQLPPGGAVVLPREALLAALADPSVQTSALPAPAGDLTIAELAAHFRRSESTVRGWVEEGRVAGAYQLPSSGKLMTFMRGPRAGTQRPRLGAWRIPRAALESFAAARANGKAHAKTLGAWRQGRR